MASSCDAACGRRAEIHPPTERFRGRKQVMDSCAHVRAHESDDHPSKPLGLKEGRPSLRFKSPLRRMQWRALRTHGWRTFEPNAPALLAELHCQGREACEEPKQEVSSRIRSDYAAPSLSRASLPALGVRYD